MGYTESQFNPQLIKRETSTTVNGGQTIPKQPYTLIDPNPGQEIVPLEDLFIYADLKVNARPKTLLTQDKEDKYTISNLNGNSISISVPQESTAVDGKTLFKNKTNLTTDWTEIGGFKTLFSETGRDYEGFGITNIDIQIKSQVAPTVVIDFVDVRGATLFEQGSCSPYGFFFQLPYPVFELTVKGYYGKAATYYLNLVKFNTKFNSETGNMESRAEFIGYSFAFLSDVLIGYVMAAALLPDSYGFRENLNNIYQKTVADYDGGVNSFCSDPSGCITILDLLKKLNDFEKEDKEDIVATSEYLKVTQLKDLLNKYKTYRETIIAFLNDTSLKNNKQKTKSGTSASNYRISWGNNTTSLNSVKTLLASGGLLATYFNNKSGLLLNNIKDIMTSPVGGGFPYQLPEPEPVKCLLKTPNQFENTNNNTNTNSSYQIYDSETIKSKQWFGPSNFWTPNTPTDGSEAPTYGYELNVSQSDNEYFIDFGYILENVDAEIKNIDEILKKEQDSLTAEIDKIVTNRFGFNPTIRNVFTILLSNTEAFMGVLKKVSVAAEEYHKTEELNAFTKTNGPSGVENTKINSSESKKATVFSWPTYFEKETNDNNGQLADVQKYPGVNEKFLAWPEIVFVEDFLKAYLKLNEEIDLLNQEFDGKPGYDNFAPINPLESPAWFDGSPNKYLNTVGKTDLYKVIGERLFIALDHSVFQPIRLTEDALLIGQGKDTGIGKGDWNPLKGDDFIKKMAELDSWNLLNSSNDKTLLSGALAGFSDTKGFINAIIEALGVDLRTTLKGGNIAKGTVVGNDAHGFKRDDDYYSYMSDKNLGISIKKNNDGEVWIHPNPFKMNPDYLIKIISPEDVNEIRGINLTNENFKNFLNNTFTTDVNRVINGLKLETTEFDPKITYAITESKQQIISFESQKLYINLAMSMIDKNPNDNEWWKSGDVNNSGQGPLGDITTNMGLIGFWDDEVTRQNQFSLNSKRVNGIYFLPESALKESDNNEYPLPLNSSQAEGEKLEKEQITTLKAPLVTTPMWLDNVRDFRVKITGSNNINTNYTEDTQYKNLAYLFLHSLKTTPLVFRLIDDNGDLYYKDDGEIKPKNENGPSLIWSLRAFNSISGVAKVPKAWLLTLGSQLWRWREFSGKNTDGSWKKFLLCEKCGVTNNTPSGSDPLIQPGYNSYDNSFLRRPVYNDNDSPIFTRIQPRNYLEAIYGGTYGTDYNKALTTPKSVFGGNTNNIENGQKINDEKNQIFFSYQSVYPNNNQTAGTYKYIDSTTTNPNVKYAWPQVYISPHHIPFIPTDIFNDGSDGEGAIFVMVTDYFAFDKKQDYQTIMPQIYNGVDYNEWNPLTIDGSSSDNIFGPTHRSKFEDGNLGMIVQYLPDSVKDKIVTIFENWALGDWKQIIKIVDPVNFAGSNAKLLDNYSYVSDDDNSSSAKNFSREAVGKTEYALVPNPNETLKKLLTDQYWVLNSTPKIWYGYQNESNNDTDKNNQFYEDGFVVTKTQFETYLTSFYTTYTQNLPTRIKEIEDANKDDKSGNKSLIEDLDLKLSIYRSFKSLSEKWIQRTPDNQELFFNIGGTFDSKLCNKKPTTLASHFQYRNRIWGDIGDKSVIDITKLNELKDNKKISLYQLITDILTDNEYMFFALPTYINLTGKFTEEESINMFKPILDISDSSCGPLFICMYVGGVSRKLALNVNNTNCKVDNNDVAKVLQNVDDDSWSLEDINQPSDVASGEFTAFKVLYGIQNQNHFKNIQLDQSEFTETAESLNVIDKLAQNQGSDRTAKGQNLNSAYLTRSYTCTIESMGNIMIQPMTYFDLQGVPMFSGAYLITEVNHNIKPNNASTSFKGVRQPRTIVPLVTSASAAMNLNFDKTKASSNAGTTSIRNLRGGVNWKDQIKTNEPFYNKINKNSKEADIMNVIRKYVEGGYYHPVTWYINDEGKKNGFSVYNRSGETMFGEDRAAGQTENTSAGADFWAYIDTQSGYGDYGTLPPTKPTLGATSANNYSRNHKTNQWDKTILQELSTRKNVWTWKYVPTNDTKLEQLSNKMAKVQVDTLLNGKWVNKKNEKTYKFPEDLKKRIKNDGRLLFAWYRARYNGPGFFQNYATNLIDVYEQNPNITDDDLLIVDLDFRWEYARTLNANSVILIQNDVLKIAEIVGAQPPNKNIVTT